MVKINHSSDAPLIVIDHDDVERMTGMGGGPVVCDVIVNHPNGHSKFFISVSINKQGRAVGEISTNGPSESSKSIRKTVVAYRRELKDGQVAYWDA